LFPDNCFQAIVPKRRKLTQLAQFLSELVNGLSFQAYASRFLSSALAT
jgi:hypothetical protein